MWSYCYRVLLHEFLDELRHIFVYSEQLYLLRYSLFPAYDKESRLSGFLQVAENGPIHPCLEKPSSILITAYIATLSTTNVTDLRNQDNKDTF